MSNFKVMMHSGTVVDVLAPDPATLLLEDIAWHLSREPRYAGALPSPWEHYSVVHHSLVVGYLCLVAEPPAEPGLVRHALLHDSPEAVLRDIPRDVKLAMRAMAGGRSPYDELESGIMVAVACQYLGGPFTDKQRVKAADDDALAAEVALLWPREKREHFYCAQATPAALDAVKSLRSLSPEHARQAFVQAMAGCAFGLSPGLFPVIGTEYRDMARAADRALDCFPIPPDVQ